MNCSELEGTCSGASNGSFDELCARTRVLDLSLNLGVQGGDVKKPSSPTELHKKQSFILRRPCWPCFASPRLIAVQRYLPVIIHSSPINDMLMMLEPLDVFIQNARGHSNFSLGY